MIIFIIIDANCADSGVQAGAIVHQADDVEAMDSAVSSWGVMGSLKVYKNVINLDYTMFRIV
jgi:hypothetical protein